MIKCALPEILIKKTAGVQPPFSCLVVVRYYSGHFQEIFPFYNSNLILLFKVMSTDFHKKKYESQI